MPCCAAVKCKTRPGMGKMMHRFPRDPHRRKLWTSKVNRENWVPSPNAFLCSDHFDDDQYENKRADNLRKLRPYAVPTLFGDQVVFRKPLETPKERSNNTDDPKPNNPMERIHLEHGYPTKKPESKALKKPKSKALQVARFYDSSTDDEGNGVEEHDQDLPNYSPDEKGPSTENAVSNLNMPLEKKIKIEEVSDDIFDDSQYVSEEADSIQKLKPRERSSSTDNSKPNNPTKKICLENGCWYTVKKIDSKELEAPLSKANSIDDENNELGKDDQDLPNDSPNETGSMTETTAIILNLILEKKLKRQTARISHLTKALKKERRMNKKLLQEKMVLEERLSEVFSPEQLHHLSRRTRRGVKWSDDVIEKALQLRIVCGSDGYQLLLSQGYPLPSERSLQRKMAMESGCCEDASEEIIENTSEEEMIENTSEEEMIENTSEEEMIVKPENSEPP